MCFSGGGLRTQTRDLVWSLYFPETTPQVRLSAYWRQSKLPQICHYPLTYLHKKSQAAPILGRKPHVHRPQASKPTHRKHLTVRFIAFFSLIVNKYQRQRPCWITPLAVLPLIFRASCPRERRIDGTSGCRSLKFECFIGLLQSRRFYNIIDRRQDIQDKYSVAA